MAYPIPKFHFTVEWGGQRLGFTEVTGLDVQTDVIEYREGNSPEFHKTKMPGMQKFSNITMKRGMFRGDNNYYEWWNSINFNAQGTGKRDLTIMLLNENHEPVVTWQVKNAWPIKVQSSDLKADGNEVAIETIEVAHEGLTMRFE